MRGFLLLLKKKSLKNEKKNADVMKEVQGKSKEHHIASAFEFHRGWKPVKSLLFRDVRQSKESQCLLGGGG